MRVFRLYKNFVLTYSAKRERKYRREREPCRARSTTPRLSWPQLPKVYCTREKKEGGKNLCRNKKKNWRFFFKMGENILFKNILVYWPVSKSVTTAQKEIFLVAIMHSLTHWSGNVRFSPFFGKKKFFFFFFCGDICRKTAERKKREKDVA